uniref:Glutathione peroxidase n=1 Tax=Naja naja TaxID=35670 RepID=A0A8C6XYH4_NAJNA
MCSPAPHFGWQSAAGGCPSQKWHAPFWLPEAQADPLLFVGQSRRPDLSTLRTYSICRFTVILLIYLTELNALQNSLKTDRLVILGFPCNQFGKQEPGQNSEILQGIKHVRPGGGYVPNFQLFQKGDVNGENEQKIYTFLKNSCPPVVETFGDTAKLFWSPLKIHDIKWNFEKFLVNPQGKPVMRWFHRPMFPL